MQKFHQILRLGSVLALVLLVAACGAAPAEPDAPGELLFTANGEDFVRQGFTSKDGWQISFDHLWVTMENVVAYRTDPPYDAATGEEPVGEQVGLVGPYTLDLAEGDEDAEPLRIGSVSAPAGQYNALAWHLVPATTGAAEGYALLLDGTAGRDEETIDFVLRLPATFRYYCGEYVGDERKGILAAGGTAEVEATFHFDHIFGDAAAPADDSLNAGALGFDPLAALAMGGTLEADLASLQAGLSEAEYQTLLDTLQTLGHVGEGHCYEATGGYTGHSE